MVGKIHEILGHSTPNPMDRGHFKRSVKFQGIHLAQSTRPKGALQHITSLLADYQIGWGSGLKPSCVGCEEKLMKSLESVPLELRNQSKEGSFSHKLTTC